jgi:hypothetical protein
LPFLSVSLSEVKEKWGKLTDDDLKDLLADKDGKRTTKRPPRRTASNSRAANAARAT